MVNPWYKEPWTWFLIAPVFSAVCFGTFFLTMAIKTNDGLVSDDYYKEGRAFNRTYDRDLRAIELNLAGQLTLDPVTGDVTLNLSGDAQWPSELTLEVVHPTRQGFDQTLQLQRLTGSTFSASLDRLDQGPRILELSPLDEDWRLRSRTYWPDQLETSFEPIEPL